MTVASHSQYINAHAAAAAPIPCLWNDCPLLLWHVGDHAAANALEPRIEECEGRFVYWNVKDADRKGHLGRVARGQHAEVRPRKWIRLFGAENGVAFERMFALGAEAAYGGYNLTYTGNVVSIGQKTVTVRDESVTSRLSIFDFLFWNRRFDAQRVRECNRRTLATL